MLRLNLLYFFLFFFQFSIKVWDFDLLDARDFYTANPVSEGNETFYIFFIFRAAKSAKILVILANSSITFFFCLGRK
jgi:hypothetical protein